MKFTTFKVSNLKVATLICLSSSETNMVDLSNEQKKMLEMSEEDIRTGKLISQEAMDKRNTVWLNAM